MTLPSLAARAACEGKVYGQPIAQTRKEPAEKSRGMPVDVGTCVPVVEGRLEASWVLSTVSERRSPGEQFCPVINIQMRKRQNVARDK
jgi:hypothetical protein